MKENLDRLKLYKRVSVLICFVFIVNMLSESAFKKHVLAQKPKNDLLLQTNSSGKEKKKMKNKSEQKSSQSKLVVVPPGSWGGDGIGLIIEKDNVKIGYDCAEGEIKQKFTVNEHGDFSMKGIYIKRYPGAVRVKFPPKRQTALYEGKISGNKMTLKVMLTETKEILKEVILERGKTPGTRRCF